MLAKSTLVSQKEASVQPKRCGRPPKIDAVPGMDTNSREFHKAMFVENAKAGNSSIKRAHTEPPFIGSLADLQSLHSS